MNLYAKNFKIDRNSRNILVVVLILVLTTLFLLPSLYNGFTSWDDNIHLLENETLRSLSWPALKLMFTRDVSLTYIPLTTLSFALEYHFFGYQPFIYHLDNLLLHLAVTALVFVLAFRLSSSLTVAATASLIFGIHPMHVESVAWVTERKDVLYSFFYLLSLNFYWSYISGRKKINYVLSLACAFLSILAKPMALSLPLILLVFDWF